MKRLICLLLIFMLPCAALGEYTMAGYDDESLARDWRTNLFFQRMETLTGVRFTYRQYTKQAEWTAAKAALRADDPDLPDVLFKAQLTPAECIGLLDRGVLIDLAPYLETCCPNLSAILAEHPEYREAITLPDGRVAALPAISEQPMQNVVWLNRDWLKALNLSMPTTADELTEVLRAFKNDDPNGNGRRDEVPLSFIGPFDLKFLGHAFGLVANDYNLRAVDGKAVFVPLEENFRPFIEWLRLLYSEGLLDRDGFTTTDQLRTVTDSSKTNVYGGAITTVMTSFLPTAWLQSYAALPPLEYAGETVYRSFNGAVFTGTFAVTSACENVEEILRWADGFYTEEVYALASMGAQDVDYIVDDDGAWRMVGDALSSPYFSSDALISSGTPFPGMSYEGLQRRYYDGAVDYVFDQLALVNAVAERPFPYYSLTAEQEAYIAPLQSRIGTIVDEAIGRWVLGQVPISDESFADFETALYAAGLEDFMQFWQDVLDGRNAQ